MSESSEAAELNAKVGKTPKENALADVIERALFQAAGAYELDAFYFHNDPDNTDEDWKLGRQALEALASLRQRQEELEDEAGTAAYVLNEAHHRNASLRTQLQQAETALRRVEDIARPGCTGVHGYEFQAIVREVQAALAAPPADPPTSSQEKP